MAEQSTHIYKTIELFENSDLKQVFDLSATNGTFVTKGEFESNFLTTPTKAVSLVQDRLVMIFLVIFRKAG